MKVRGPKELKPDGLTIRRLSTGLDFRPKNNQLSSVFGRVKLFLAFLIAGFFHTKMIVE